MVKVWRSLLDKVRIPTQKSFIVLPQTGSWMIDYRYESKGFTRLVIFDRLAAFQVDIPYHLNLIPNTTFAELRYYKDSSVVVQSLRKFYISFLLWLLMGVKRVYRRRLRVVGRGYKIQYFPHRRCVVFKIGFTHAITFWLPLNVSVRVTKKGRKIYFFSNNIDYLSRMVQEIFLFHPSEVYTGHGLRLTHHLSRIKPGKTQ